MLRKCIPNLVTLANLFCGFLAIGFAAKGDFKNAGILILMGMMLDSVDGRLARKLNVTGPMGKELDSLADIVTFGVAPALLVYYVAFFKYGFVGMMISGLFPLFGAYRLARFNISSQSSLEYFSGVPITAAGGIMTLIALLDDKLPSIILPIAFTALSLLMVSTVKIPSFKKVPLPKYGTIVTLLFGCIIYLIFKSTQNTFPHFIYVAIPLYIAFITYQFKKSRAGKRKRNNESKES